MHINFNSFISTIAHHPLQFIKKNVTSIVGLGLAAIGLFGANLFRKAWHSDSYTMPTNKKMSVSKEKESKSTQIFKEQIQGSEQKEKKPYSHLQPTATQRAVTNELQEAMKASLKRRGHSVPESKTEKIKPREQAETSLLKTAKKPKKKEKKHVRWQDIEDQKKISSTQPTHTKSKSQVSDKPKGILKNKKNPKAEDLKNPSETKGTLPSLTKHRSAPAGRRPPSRKP